MRALPHLSALVDAQINARHAERKLDRHHDGLVYTERQVEEVKNFDEEVGSMKHIHMHSGRSLASQKIFPKTPKSATVIC